MPAQIIYRDDADSFVAWTVTDTLGQTLDWADPQIAVGAAAYGVASWQGVAGPTREIRLVTSNGLGLNPGIYAAYLKVPNGNDFPLGDIHVRDRT